MKMTSVISVTGVVFFSDPEFSLRMDVNVKNDAKTNK